VRIHYRDIGEGPPIVILHGGWGYDAYPFDRQIAVLAPRHRLVIPDRTGYGGSGTLDALPTDFHQRAADEARAVMDALVLERPILWGHSDGAIIALLMGLAAPDRISGAIVEATHYFKHKPASRAFFEAVAANPRSKFLETHSRTWLRIADEALPGEDFYGGRLAQLEIPLLVIHGARDPRTEPGELEALRKDLGVGADPRVGPGRTHGSATTALATCSRIPIAIGANASASAPRGTTVNPGRAIARTAAAIRVPATAACTRMPRAAASRRSSSPIVCAGPSSRSRPLTSIDTRSPPWHS
jgi:pimeloyl-ACP methyl ester carboxylesterase